MRSLALVRSSAAYRARAFRAVPVALRFDLRRWPSTHRRMTVDTGGKELSAPSLEVQDISGITVVMVTPSELLAQTVHTALAASGCNLLGNWRNVGIDLISELLRAATAVVLLDYAFLLTEGGKYLERLCQLGSNIKILVIAEALTDKMKCEILWAGGHGYIAVAQLGNQLRKAIYETAGGGQWFERHILYECTHDHVNRAMPGEKDDAIDTRNARFTEKLTRREHDVVALVGQGLRNKEIARKLAISENTVKLHLNRIYRKLGMSSRLQLGVSLGAMMMDSFDSPAGEPEKSAQKLDPVEK